MLSLLLHREGLQHDKSLLSLLPQLALEKPVLKVGECSAPYCPALHPVADAAAAAAAAAVVVAAAHDGK